MIRVYPTPIPSPNRLAVTAYGETAVYDERGPHDDEEVSSFSGEDWLPFPSTRLTIFIPGIPGAGKSYLTKEIISLYPESAQVILFTALEEDDDNFKGLPQTIWKIKLNEKNLKEITLSKLRERIPDKVKIAVFDDIDKIRNSKINELVQKLMADILVNGRGHKNKIDDIHFIATTHTLNDYQKTKYLTENCEYIALFPLSTLEKQMIVLTDKIGLDKKTTQILTSFCKENSIRRMIIKKTAPQIIIIGHLIKLLT